MHGVMGSMALLAGIGVMDEGEEDGEKKMG